MADLNPTEGTKNEAGAATQGAATSDSNVDAASAATNDRPNETSDSDAELRKQLEALKKENFGYREAERLRKEEELARTGKHEELITSLRGDNEALKAKADKWDAHQAAETAAIEKEAKEKLSKEDRDIVLAEPDLARRRVLLNRFGSQVKPQQDPTPAASPPQATTNKAYADMTPDERKAFDQARKKANNTSPVVQF